jgi:hypothetical protein
LGKLAAVSDELFSTTTPCRDYQDHSVQIRHGGDAIVKKLEAAIADSVRDPEYIESSSGDEPVLAFMPGAE